MTVTLPTPREDLFFEVFLIDWQYTEFKLECWSCYCFFATTNAFYSYI